MGVVRPARPTLALPPGTTGTGASRRSAISEGTYLVHADLHNHTTISDGEGDPALAFAFLREAGLDVAALTDHAHPTEDLRATLGPRVGGGAASAAISLAAPQPDALMRYLPRPRGGMSPDGWRRTVKLADAADEPGVFTALRGFEWTEPWLGHVNVWLSADFTPVQEYGGMTALLDWLAHGDGGRLAGLGNPGDSSDLGDLGDLRDIGDLRALAGFNHPGREPGRFAGFAYAAAARPSLVSMEIFNRYDDYLFERYDEGVTSPLVACLGAGWRPGLIGVTDEHGDDWGYSAGKGRAGLWVTSHTRAGVYEALRARRVFATREAGLRLDATAAGVRMGGALPHDAGPVEFAVDLDGGTGWAGRTADVQVLRPGVPVPQVADVVPVNFGRPLRFSLPVDRDEGEWVVLRVADPTAPNAAPGPAGHPANNAAIAYTSPWYLTPRAG